MQLDDPIAAHIDPILWALNHSKLAQHFGQAIDQVQIQWLGSTGRWGWEAMGAWKEVVACCSKKSPDVSLLFQYPSRVVHICKNLMDKTGSVGKP